MDNNFIKVEPGWKEYTGPEDLKYATYSDKGKFKSNGINWVHFIDIVGIDFGDYTAIGVDPGRRFGVTIIQNGVARIYYGYVPQIDGVQFMYTVKNMIFRMVNYRKLPLTTPGFIEGAAFGKPYGQVPLAEIRAGFYMGLAEYGIFATIKPPMTIRKKVLGNGRSKMYETLLGINQNGADSFGVALYGFE